ncbi:hypothetical protein SRB5_05790 [Streptomyces sp. RB5]|uniref:Alpha/beta hydrolase domain-containing protein n=1 Tax=Streptomyces smaragdinus TaxID=2585196 RepID=A0A7K0CAJ1_9ACTN|nr:alpha/beta hydrolase domain-containing protein [Streptomyces smaragdinus]MQY10471.1 hypothetical protein [Streptomyces smaragdinus]
MPARLRTGRTVLLAAALSFAVLLTPYRTAAGSPRDEGRATVEGPIPGTVPGDPQAGDVADTYPFFSTPVDLAAKGYVEQEFYLSGRADGFSATGEQVADDVPYRTRIVVRRPVAERDFSGTVLMEWQNVTAGYDLDALWNPDHVIRRGHVWVGVSAQRVGVDQLAGWSPARYGELDVTGERAYTGDELSYDIFAQAALAVRDPQGARPLGRLDAERVLALGASQSAGRMTVYYDRILPSAAEPPFDGYAFVVGQAPAREGAEPVFHVLSETDVRTPVGRRADTDLYRRWEVAGAAHSGWEGQVYRAPVSERDLGAAPQYECTAPPFSRVPMSQVTTRAYDLLDAWVQGRTPPHAPYLEFAGTEPVRNELGLAQGGIQLSQVAVPTALNTGRNTGQSFCTLFGTHVPFDGSVLDALYPNPGGYIGAVARTDAANVRAGYLAAADARENLREAVGSGVGR